jgi:type IV pilus assembly protein PilA
MEAPAMRRDQAGFSLIELLIVVAIILIISAIAIPNLMRSKMAANESSAVGSLRTINTAEVTYSIVYNGVGFANLAALGGASPCASVTSSASCLIDNVLASGTKSGYNFSTTAGSGTPSVTYTSLATAVSAGQTGQRAFCSDQSGVIYVGAVSPACTIGANPL